MRIIFLNETSSRGGLHGKALRIQDECCIRWNIGAICLRDGCLDLKAEDNKGGRYLIQEIEEARGNFIDEAGYYESDRGKTHCWEGTGYQGGVDYGSVNAAVRYLKKYFEVRACKGNRRYTQKWVDAL